VYPECKCNRKFVESSLMGQGPSVQKKKFNEKEHEFFVDRLKARFPRDSFATASNRNVVQLEPIKQEVRRIESESKSINVSVRILLLK
jgi:hypothetical protein